MPVVSKRYLLRRESFIVDLNFTSMFEKTSKIIISPLRRDVILKNLTNPDSFFFKNFIGSMDYYLVPKLDLNSGKLVSDLANGLNIGLLVCGGIMIVLAGIMLWKEFDVTHILLEFTRMAKTIHRLKFINVDQTPLVHYFLGKVYNIYQSGLDRQRDEVDRYQIGYRGRLTEIGVPVFPLVNFADKYMIYLIVNMVYYSFKQVSKYIAVGKDKVAVRERQIMKLVGKIKIIVVLMIANDLVFSSSRNLLHYNTNTRNESN
jgi:hypothetical protein